MLKATCPSCQRRVRLPLYRHATTVVRRTCRCGAAWAVKVVPVQAPRLEARGMRVHTATFSPVAR